MIDTGQQAPDFTLYDDRMEPFHLTDQRGERVVLLFFPGAFTSVCTEELCTVSDQLEDFDGAHVVALSTDSPPVLAEFRRANGLKMPLLSDHDASVCGDYGARYDEGFLDPGYTRVAKRAAFVLDEEGTVRYAEVLEDAGQQPDFEAVRSVLQSNGQDAA